MAESDAPYIKLQVDIWSSKWVRKLHPLARLMWPILLTYVKSMSRSGGQCKLPDPEEVCRFGWMDGHEGRYEEMLEAAVADGSVFIDEASGVLQICNWRTYQTDASAAARMQKLRSQKDPKSDPKTAMLRVTPVTKPENHDNPGEISSEKNSAKNGHVTRNARNERIPPAPNSDSLKAEVPPPVTRNARNTPPVTRNSRDNPNLDIDRDIDLDGKGRELVASPIGPGKTEIAGEGERPPRNESTRPDGSLDEFASQESRNGRSRTAEIEELLAKRMGRPKVYPDLEEDERAKREAIEKVKRGEA